ncbi:MAG TPA: GNAT family N-acetyltransferase [Kofleriaceae bacterium]
MQLRWHERGFSELSVDELYAIMALRERVFIVEQNCPYLEADGLDPQARHVWAEDAGEIRAYLRILPAGLRFEEHAIGRVIVAPVARGTGLGKELMRRGVAIVGDVPIRLHAQAHLEKFYRDLGFEPASDVYDEDGIPHLDMLRPAAAKR